MDPVGLSETLTKSRHPMMQSCNQALKAGLADVLRGGEGGAAPLRLLLTAREVQAWLSGGGEEDSAEAARHWAPDAIARAIVCKHG